MRSVTCALPLRALLASGFFAASTMLTSAAPPESKPTANHVEIAKNYGKIPLSFEANQGQTDKQVKFLSRGQGYSLFLTDSAAVLSLTKSQPHLSRSAKESRPQVTQTDIIRMELAGASKSTAVTGNEQLPGTANYFIGSDPAKWHSNVPTYAKVQYKSVYPGIDLVYYGNQRQLEYDFVVAPGANPNSIRLHFAGAKQLRLAPNGDLKIVATNGQVTFNKPVLYQQIGSLRQPVEGRFNLLADRTIGFIPDSYDRSRPLVIDPTLAYATYLGGSGQGDSGQAITVDLLGFAYVAGYTTSADFPTTLGSFNPIGTTRTGGAAISNAFITKLNLDGTGLIYSTYLGGLSQADYTSSACFGGYYGGSDEARGIAIDEVGNAYVAGCTSSVDFPVSPGAFQTQLKGYSNAFVAKLDVTGSTLMYSTYLGGGGEVANAIALDVNDNAYVAGSTGSDSFPTTSDAYQTKRQGSTAFVTKLNQDGTNLVYSTFLGGAGADPISAIAVGGGGEAYVTGSTASKAFPVTLTAFQTTNNEATATGTCPFVAKLDASGSLLLYATYLGGTGGDGVNDYASGIAVDEAGYAYVTGTAGSPDFPTTTGAYQTKNNTKSTYGTNAFVTELNLGATGLVYSTFLGGSGADGASAITLDIIGNAYITGNASSNDFPLTADAYQKTLGAKGGSGNPAFLAELNPTGTQLSYSSFLGGSRHDYGKGVAVDIYGNAYIVGTAESTDFPVTPGAFQSANKSGYYGLDGNAFVAKFVLAPPIATTLTLTGSPNPQYANQPVTFTAVVAGAATTQPPGGTVSFAVDSGVATTVKVDSTGRAIYTTSALTQGTHTILASYSGDIYFSPSSASTTETITLPQTATPVFSPLPGTYYGPQSVTISESTPGAIVYYTTNGTVPTTASAQYNGAIPVSATETIEALAVATGYANSKIASGTYTIAPTSGSASLSPTNLNFPTTVVGAASPTQPITVTNTGTTAITVKSYTFTGQNANAFSIQAKTCGSSLPVGSSCTVSVSFKPTIAGTLTASLVATDSATNTPQTVALTGTGQLPPTVAITPDALTFPATTLGSSSAAQVITVKNIGTTTLTVKSYLFTGVDASSFALSAKTCTTSLAAGASCTLTVTFKPTAIGTLTASLVATDSSPNSPQTIALTGTGAAQPTVTLTPSSLTFAATKVGTTSAAQVVTLTNTGTTALVARSYTFTGSNASSFELSSKTCGTSLAAGASCTLSVSFKPAATGALTGNLAATDNAVGSPQTTVLSGTGK